MGRFGKTSKHAGKVQTANTGKSDIAIMKNKHTTTPSQSIHPTKSQIKPSHPKVYRPNTSIVANPNKYPEKGANFGASYGVQTGNPVQHKTQQRFRHQSVTAAKTIMGFPAAVVDKMGNLIPASHAQRQDAIMEGQYSNQSGNPRDKSLPMGVEGEVQTSNTNLVYNPATGYMEPKHNPNPRGSEKNLKKNQFNPFGL